MGIPVSQYTATVNNRAETVLACFRDAIERFSLPSRIRCDCGTENYDVAYFMLSHPLRGVGRSSVIAGSSVHNQRVERFWRDLLVSRSRPFTSFSRDLFVGCTGIFYNLFQ